MHHLALGARDVRRVASFYEEVFDLERLKEHFYADGRLRSVWLTLGDGVLMVEHTTATRGHVEGVGAGPFLIAFRVDATERPSFEARLRRRGSLVEASTAATSYARDPEGNRVAISHYDLP